MSHFKLGILVIVACLVMACDPMAPDPKSLVVVVTPTIAPTAVALAIADQPTVAPPTVVIAAATESALAATSDSAVEVALASEPATLDSGGSSSVDVSTQVVVPTQDVSTPDVVGQAVATQVAEVPTDTPQAVPTEASGTQDVSTEAALAQATAAPVIPPTTPGACTDTKGQVIDLTFASKILQEAERYRVYLPPCYSESGRRYPYVILLHGSDGDETEWTSQLKVNEVMDAGLSNHSLTPMILIMPNGGDLANLNQFQAVSWENLIVNEMMPEIEQNFCTWNAREGRDIGGISRGGFWAFEIAFRHTDLFGAIGGHSAFFDPDNAPPAYNPLGLAKTVQFAPGMQPRIWLDAGKDDYARPNLEIFKKALDARNIDSEYTMNPVGKHEVAYWAMHVSEYLSFYGQTWPHNVQDLPSCLQ